MQFVFDIDFGKPLLVTRADDPYFLTTVCFVIWIIQIYKCQNSLIDFQRNTTM